MCLGVPAQVESFVSGDDELLVGQVRFGEVSKAIHLCFVPEVKIGDYVIVHAGFAISIVSEEEAQKTLSALETLEEELWSEDEVRI